MPLEERIAKATAAAAVKKRSNALEKYRVILSKLPDEFRTGDLERVFGLGHYQSVASVRQANRYGLIKHIRFGWWRKNDCDC